MYCEPSIDKSMITSECTNFYTIIYFSGTIFQNFMYSFGSIFSLEITFKFASFF